MDIDTLLLGLMTVTMVLVTLHARRLRNEKRDVVLLGAVAALCGAGTLIASLN